MQLKCSHCHKSFLPTEIKDHRGKGLKMHIACPHCQAWLARHMGYTLAKLLAFYGGIIALICSFVMDDTSQVTTL
ncbi:hypothetical protein EXU30_13075 [Shewanella maritima]|uniref:Uncharacterized protein n=1 Tax=Shewanella maritima TaxID=2520507 RepID=A0A411PIV9_9GAMM|nr:hypothetical protein [Shewanella maritima]QBF83519.1 hypothetical protein EXU30_13075 [Shewanella maritima]